MFGDLQSAVFTALQARGSASVAEVHADLSRSRSIAYTTVMTVMSRLAERGLLVREKDGRRYVYARSADPPSETGARLRRLFDGLMIGFRRPAITHFVEAVSELDELALSELEEEILQARLRRDGGQK